MLAFLSETVFILILENSKNLVFKNIINELLKLGKIKKPTLAEQLLEEMPGHPEQRR